MRSVCGLHEVCFLLMTVFSIFMGEDAVCMRSVCGVALFACSDSLLSFYISAIFVSV